MTDSQKETPRIIEQLRVSARLAEQAALHDEHPTQAVWFNEAADEIDRLTRELTAALSETARLEKELEGARRTIARWEGDGIEADAQIGTLTACLVEAHRARDQQERFKWAANGRAESLQSRLTAAEQSRGEAERLIASHNAECDGLCTKQAANCEPFTSRGRRCPECPRDWKIDDSRAIALQSDQQEGK